jgi:hypothetical protein
MATPTPSEADAKGPMTKPGDGKGRPTTAATTKRRYTVTPKVMAAHRESAKKSTGPRSVAGKDRSRRSALKHGLTAFKVPMLVWGEDATAYDELYQTVLREYPPLDATGQWAVRQLTNAFWRSRRLEQAERALLIQETSSSLDDAILTGDHGIGVGIADPGTSS